MFYSIRYFLMDASVAVKRERGVGYLDYRKACVWGVQEVPPNVSDGVTWACALRG